MKKTIALQLGILFFSAKVMAQADVLSQLDSCNVTWNEPGPDSTASMPIGNGNIGLNVWVEKNGDLVFYISKTDAWGAETRPEWDQWMKTGGVLMKLGAVRISQSPSPLTAGGPFIQTLRVHEGEISIKEGTASLRVWVDANHPVIRVEVDNPSAALKVSLDDWRLYQGDTVLPGESGNITWYHQNPTTADTNLAGRIFGAAIVSGKKLVSIYPLTTADATPAIWRSRLRKQIAAVGRIPLEQARTAHRAWWDRFWHRSWVFVHGDEQAGRTTKGYVLQRYVTACAGRGAYPIKFNGSIFTVSRDFRAWGGQYWFQNTRAMYWPRLMAGDFDMMLPLFNMYARMLPGNEALVQQYYHHDGAYFQETSPFWGGLPYMGPEAEPKYTNHYFTPILELSMMMLDYFEYTGDTVFARQKLVPVATAGITFFDKHFGRDIMGKLLLDPDNSIEMFWKVHDPAPDIAALKAVLPRMIALPDGLASTETRQSWRRLLKELPPLPMGATSDGRLILLPYTGAQTARSFNEENPELYSVYPYRLYSLLKPEVDVAQTTFLRRKFKAKGCWEQDPIQAAMLGYADAAREFTSFNLTRKEPRLKFPAFWATGHDYAPDEDNGGNGENGLQQMLMQTDGRSILLLPAWPADWDAEFKLNAPYRTTIEGKVVNGKLTELKVTPASRRADVIVKGLPPPFEGEKTAWHEGFYRRDFLMDEKTNIIRPIKAAADEQYGARPAEKGKIRCIVIAPKKAAPGNPWSWRGCYWDHEPQTEVELLRRGYHIAFIMCDPDTHWEAWYRFLTEEHGLSKRPAFIGMSRGGINEYAWAAMHPDKVSCIYADNPALRPESMSKLAELARHDIPLLHVCGSYDFLLQEHTLKVEDIYHRLGGRISVLIKEGPGHHPHSLRDPALIAGWMESNTAPERSLSPVIPGIGFDKSYYYSYANSYRYLKEENTYATCRGPLFTGWYVRWDEHTGSDLGIEGMTIIAPRIPAQGKPWVFHADVIGHETDTVDLALLAKGFYIVSAPVTSQAGPLTEQWDKLYEALTGQGFSKTPVMEGAGAGGGEAYYWAIAHPDRVSCIYAKDPILRSLRAKAALVDSLEPMARAGIPLLHLCDPRKPWNDVNTGLVEKNYRQLGGSIKIFTNKKDVYEEILRSFSSHGAFAPNMSDGTAAGRHVQDQYNAGDGRARP
ncbi:MAG TPA: DUF5703 domain-containing protein [Puia sp.]